MVSHVCLNGRRQKKLIVYELYTLHSYYKKVSAEYQCSFLPSFTRFFLYISGYKRYLVQYLTLALEKKKLYCLFSYMHSYKRRINSLLFEQIVSSSFLRKKYAYTAMNTKKMCIYDKASSCLCRVISIV